MKQLITHIGEIPKYALDGLNDVEYHILTSLFDRKLFFYCHLSLNGFKIEPKNFEYLLPFGFDIYRRKEKVLVEAVVGRSFDKTLKNFVAAIHSRETKHGTVYLKSTERKDNYSTDALQVIKESYLVLLLRHSRIDQVDDAQTREIYEELEKRRQAILGHAMKTTKIF
ncbi:MAG TPA: hypothetical protein PK950_00745 [Candidatus Paceibacterota bacterium]|nr:hypothetical protein [Candidatus Paceibacterota bacterium]